MCHFQMYLFSFSGKNTEWDKVVTSRIEVWQKYFSNWILNSESRPVLVVRFEDLKTDLIGQVKRMLDFLKFPYMEDELRSRLAAQRDLTNFGEHMVQKILTILPQFSTF